MVPSGGLNSYASDAMAASSFLVHRENRGTLLISSIFASFRRATRGSYCSGSAVSAQGMAPGSPTSVAPIVRWATVMELA
jgi:hypothetical protein